MNSYEIRTQRFSKEKSLPETYHSNLIGEMVLSIEDTFPKLERAYTAVKESADDIGVLQTGYLNIGKSTIFPMGEFMREVEVAKKELSDIISIGKSFIGYLRSGQAEADSARNHPERYQGYVYEWQRTTKSYLDEMNALRNNLDGVNVKHTILDVLKEAVIAVMKSIAILTVEAFNALGEGFMAGLRAGGSRLSFGGLIAMIAGSYFALKYYEAKKGNHVR